MHMPGRKAAEVNLDELKMQRRWKKRVNLLKKYLREQAGFVELIIDGGMR